jgi:DNA (cytosine-5)-methyltransferase 1
VLKRALEIQAAIPAKVLAEWRRSDDDSAPVAFACNQRDEVRDLHGVAGAVQAQQGMKQQTFIAAIPINTQVATRHGQLGEGTGLGIGSDGDPAFTLQAARSHAVYAERTADCLTPWDTQQARIHSPDGPAPTVAGADGGGGRNPAGLVFAAFLAEAGAKARSIGYEQECSPTLKGSAGGNMMPSIICLNDQGGQRMDISEEYVGTLRSQMDGHVPLVMATQQGGAEICEDLCPTITSAAGASGNNQPVLFENHGIDSRYTGPLEVAPTIGARAGTGGNNVPLAIDEPETYAISGNAVDRQPHNGGNGIGYQRDIAYTVTATDRHCVYTQQRSDTYAEEGVASTQVARQYKDSTDLVCEVAGLDLRNGSENGDLCGTLQSKTGGGYSLNNLHPIRIGSLVRRLTPLECERLMGFPDHWTKIPGSSDSKQYRACGNSVAIPCVEYIMMGIAAVRAEEGA